MFKMLEIVGSSEIGFSEAVKEAIEQVIKSGEKVHFFEVIEQRGAVRQGKFKEFQVKLKVAIEIGKAKVNEKQISKEKTENICPLISIVILSGVALTNEATKFASIKSFNSFNFSFIISNFL